MERWEEVTPKTKRHLTMHGMSHTRIYQCWSSMRQRCFAKTGRYKKMYSDRGIGICKEWDDFKTFYKWAIDNGYRENLTLDRINNMGNYEPQNCRWATPKMQANNREITIRIEYAGQTKTLAEWSEETGINYRTLLNRYRKGESGGRLFRSVQRRAV